MIVAFENNVVCSDEKVRDYLLAHHADLKEDQDEDALCLVRLHKEEDIDGTDRVDLAGWREIRENFIGLGNRWSAIILLSVLAGRLLLCRCRSYCQPATSLNGWRRCCGDMKPRILRTLN